MQRTELVHILTAPKAQENIHQMFEVGTMMHQESAFAAYTTGEISELHVPVIETGISIDDIQAVDQQMRRVDRAGLVYTEPLPARPIGSSAARKIAALEAHPELNRFTRQRLIATIKARECAQSISGEIRDDIVLLSHNHRLKPDYLTGKNGRAGIDDILRPSPTDLHSYNTISRKNPGLVEVIIAATRTQQKALLFTANDTNAINVGVYEHRQRSRRGLMHALGNLSLAGATYIIVDLESDGALSPESQERVSGFGQAIQERLRASGALR